MWGEVRSQMDGSSVEVRHVIAEECAIRFARMSMQNVRTQYQYAATRNTGLLQQNLCTRQGRVWSSNACLAVFVFAVLNAS